MKLPYGSELLPENLELVEPIHQLSEPLPRPSDVLGMKFPAKSFGGDEPTKTSAKIILGVLASNGDTWRHFSMSELPIAFTMEALEKSRWKIVGGILVPFGGGYVVKTNAHFVVTMKFIREVMVPA